MSTVARLPQFDRFVSTYRRIADAKDLNWDIPVGPDGSVSKEFRWDIGDITGTPKPPAFYLSNFGRDRSTLAVLNEQRASLGSPPIKEEAMSTGWQDLLKALTVRALFEKRTGASHISMGLLRPVRALATACEGREPWELTGEDINTALKILGRVDKNSKLQSLVETVVIILDDNRLSAFSPVLGQRSKTPNRKRRVTEIRSKLEERRRPDRLPSAREFWEMLRIILEERPTSFYDMVRFGAVELAILMGLRSEEVATIPVGPAVLKHHVDFRGQNAFERGGIGHTMFLRHFSEKQGLRSARSVIYAETSTSVLRMFEDEVGSVLERIERTTASLRARLAAQIQTGRIFPEYELDEIVPLSEIYPRLTGNPFVFEGARNTELSNQYREELDPKVLIEIQKYQHLLSDRQSPYSNAFILYMSRADHDWLPLRELNASKFRPSTFIAASRRYEALGVLVSELEDAVRANIPSKLSDCESFPLETGRELNVHKCLFLVPKRAVFEGRNDGVCDVTRYAFVGRLTSQDISLALSDRPSGFFAKYGKTEAAAYKLNPHAMRHMHNNELFAAGVADTVITHRFGRKSVAESYEYDSRTLAQELADMELPSGSADLLMGPARDAFKLITSNRGSGKIVDEFRRIQEDEGDEAAIVFLATEADGLQITPYGLCLNSFVVEPCPRHLECFGGCSHLMRTGLAGETAQLEKLANRYRTVLTSIDRHPGSESAKAKAMAQASARLAAIEQAISTKVGEFVFPEGEDLSRPFKDARMTGLIE